MNKREEYCAEFKAEILLYSYIIVEINVIKIGLTLRPMLY